MSDTAISAIVVAAIGGAFTIINAILSYFLSRRKSADERDTAMANGLQCLLRIKIIDLHDKYSQQKYCPIYAKENLTRAYSAYHALGGNDVATDLYRQIMELPESKEVHND